MSTKNSLHERKLLSKNIHQIIEASFDQAVNHDHKKPISASNIQKREKLFQAPRALFFLLFLLHLFTFRKCLHLELDTSQVWT